MAATLSKDAARPASDPPAEDDSPDSGPMLDPDVQHQLGMLLRGMYDDLLSRPVPDHLLAILECLGERPGTDHVPERSGERRETDPS